MVRGSKSVVVAMVWRLCLGLVQFNRASSGRSAPVLLCNMAPVHGADPFTALNGEMTCHKDPVQHKAKGKAKKTEGAPLLLI
jgi:hypothetical protein